MARAKKKASNFDYDEFLFDIQEIQRRGGEYKDIPLDRITPNPNQPRKKFDRNTLKELSDSIRQNGVLQPILVRSGKENGEYVIIAGERRFRASKNAKLDTIPTIVWNGDENLDLELAITENLLREDLSPIEESEAIGKLKKLKHYSDRQIADFLGKSRSSISEIIKLNDLPKEIKDACRNADTPPAKSLLLHIVRQGSKKAMLKAWQQYLKGQFSIIKAREKSQKKSAGKTKSFRWEHKTKEFSFTLKINNGEDNKSYIISTLEKILDELRNQEESEKPVTPVN